ncbi:hypothetical protein AAHH86_00210 [Candidatus Hodgkinia cicadicola]
MAISPIQVWGFLVVVLLCISTRFYRSLVGRLVLLGASALKLTSGFC